MNDIHYSKALLQNLCNRLSDLLRECREEATAAEHEASGRHGSPENPSLFKSALEDPTIVQGIKDTELRHPMSQSSLVRDKLPPYECGGGEDGGNKPISSLSVFIEAKGGRPSEADGRHRGYRGGLGQGGVQDSVERRWGIHQRHSTHTTMSTGATIYEVRGNFPDTSIRYTHLLGEAKKLKKQSPETLCILEDRVPTTAKGLAEWLTRHFAFLDDGVVNRVSEDEDIPRTQQLQDEVMELKREKARLESLLEEADDDGL